MSNSGLCACGCGGKTPPATRTNGAKNVRKGEPTRCMPGHKADRRAFAGADHPRWKGGRFVTSHGYVLVHEPAHPRASAIGYVFEHIKVASEALGKPIPPTAHIHHINEDKADNRPENLVVCQDAAYHFLLHQRTRAYRACGHADWAKCYVCKEWGPKETLKFPSGRSRSPFHGECVARLARDRRVRAKRS